MAKKKNILPWIVNHKCELSCFKHYATKSLEESCKKFLRGYADREFNGIIDRFKEGLFNYFCINDMTDEKLNFIKENFGIIFTPGDELCNIIKKIKGESKKKFYSFGIGNIVENHGKP